MRLIDALAERLKGKWRRTKGIVRSWIRMRLVLAIARATSACIRGCRRLPRGAAEDLEIEIGDGAGIAPMMDLGGMQRPGGSRGD